MWLCFGRKLIGRAGTEKGETTKEQKQMSAPEERIETSSAGKDDELSTTTERAQEVENCKQEVQSARTW